MPVLAAHQHAAFSTGPAATEAGCTLPSAPATVQEFLPGTHDRACSITGTPEAVEIAQRLIQQKIDAHLQ